MRHDRNWFEIPVRDLDRAAACYETLLGRKLRREVLGGVSYGIFPYEEPGIIGALVEDPGRPAGDGVVYFDADGALDAILARADAAHATVVLPKTEIGADGYLAIVADTEGNHVGLKSLT